MLVDSDNSSWLFYHLVNLKWMPKHFLFSNNKPIVNYSVNSEFLTSSYLINFDQKHMFSG